MHTRLSLDTGMDFGYEAGTVPSIRHRPRLERYRFTLQRLLWF